jgi:hypothetical protein
MKFLSILMGVMLILFRVDAQLPSPAGAVRSRSGQFLARTIAQRPVLSGKSWEAVKVPVTGQAWGFLLNPRAGSTSGVSQMNLEPASLTIASERLKELLLFELGASDQWRGRITLLINSALPENEEPNLTAIRHRDGWNYELELPPRLKTDQLLQSLVHVLLLEMANRNAGDASTQIPLWLVEGMTAHLRNSQVPTFLIQPDVRTIGNKFELVGLELVREKLREKTALTFKELSWPEPDSLSGDKFQFYQACSQLFVNELLRLRDGRNCLRHTIEHLPAFLNWQLAFMRGFQPIFKDLLDVEKWWGLACVSFTGHDAAQVRSGEDSWRTLQETLDVPVQIHLETNRLPAAAVITLQEVIMQWEPAREVPTLQKIAAQLMALHARLTPDLVPLADRYRVTLDGYLRSRQSPPRSFGKVNLDAMAELKRKVCRELTLLDSQREALRPKILNDRKSAELSAMEMATQGNFTRSGKH